MNFLIAKIRERRQRDPKYWKLLSIEEDLYTVDPSMPHVPYNPATNLDEDEWFSLDSFSQHTFFLPFLKDEFNSSAYLQFREQDFSKLDFLFSYQGNGNFFCFQNITKSQLVRKKCIYLDGIFFSINREYVYSADSKSIPIHSIPDAIYQKDIDRLYFKRLSSITSIFDGISVLFREATNEETQEFLNNPMISLENGFNASNVKTPNRKRIALAMQTLSRFDDREMNELFTYIRQYCNDLRVVDERAFVIGSEDQLKALLYGIEQRYYTTPVDQEKRLANSVVSLRDSAS